MKKSFIVDYELNEMRLDRRIRNNLGKMSTLDFIDIYSK